MIRKYKHKNRAFKLIQMIQIHHRDDEEREELDENLN